LDIRGEEKGVRKRIGKTRVETYREMEKEWKKKGRGSIFTPPQVPSNISAVVAIMLHCC